METRKREEGKEGKKRETTDPKLTIFSQRQLPLMVVEILECVPRTDGRTDGRTQSLIEM